MFGDPLMAGAAQSDAQVRVQEAGGAVGAAAEFVNFGRGRPAIDGSQTVAPAEAISGEDDLAAIGSGCGLRCSLLRDRSHEPDGSVTVCNFQPSSSSGEYTTAGVGPSGA